MSSSETDKVKKLRDYLQVPEEKALSSTLPSGWIKLDGQPRAILHLLGSKVIASVCAVVEDLTKSTTNVKVTGSWSIASNEGKNSSGQILFILKRNELYRVETNCLKALAKEVERQISMSFGPEYLQGKE